ncbi:hypothetical protein ACVC7V_26485 [Hydrogenophaga sp. A37]|uniref:hypothetical protein n=1 Tax=Hydrogenophaga sp. A37 TaxID=1945864 RepID=UPI0015C573C6|nr:hypothetical protein [Hydrogenophaga sp. A37]
MHPMVTLQPTAIPTGCAAGAEAPLLQVRPTRRPYSLPEFADASPEMRSDLAPWSLGVPLTLVLRLHDGAGQAIQRAAVYIWHYDPCCWLFDAGDDELKAVAMMRGVQLSDADGRVRFQTVYPGRYRDNTVPVYLQIYFNDGRHVIARADACLLMPALAVSAAKERVLAPPEPPSLRQPRFSATRDAPTLAPDRLVTDLDSGGLRAEWSMGIALDHARPTH